MSILNYRKNSPKNIYIQNNFFFGLFIFLEEKKICNSNFIQAGFAPGCYF